VAKAVSCPDILRRCFFKNLENLNVFFLQTRSFWWMHSIPYLEMSGPSNDSCQVKKKVEACGGVLNAMWAGGFEGVFFV